MVEHGEDPFGIITCQAIRRDTFTSVKDLIAAIETLIDGWNDRCEPFVRDQDRRRQDEQSTPPSNEFKYASLARCRVLTAFAPWSLRPEETQDRPERRPRSRRSGDDRRSLDGAELRFVGPDVDVDVLNLPDPFPSPSTTTLPGQSATAHLVWTCSSSFGIRA